MPDSRPRILVVDDRRENLVASVAALEGQGYDIVTASCGADALREVLAGQFAVILLDVVMEDMDGFEVAALIKQKKRTRNVPIVFFTADHDQAASRKGYDLGALDFLAKPVDPATLRSKVAALVALDQERRDAERRYAAGEKELAEARQQAEHRLHSLADAIPHVVFTGRPDGAFDSLNRQWTLCTGLPVEQGLGMGWMAAIHPEDAGRMLERWLAAADDRVELEARLRMNDGTYRTHLVQLVRDDVVGGPGGWVGTFTDVEAQRVAEAALREREQQLSVARRLEAVGRIAGGVAHDFNNLLTAVLGYATVALQAVGPEHPAHPRIVAIRETAERATSITNQLLAFSRRKVLRPEVLDLDDVVGAMEATLRPLVGERIAFELHRSAAPLWVRADRSQLEQVLLNLVINARDAMPAGGRLWVTVAAVEDGGAPCALIEVRDTGVGMDADTQAMMFEPFFTTKSAGRGTGLGLSTVHGVVSQSGGTITVQSAPGEGSTFRVVLPLCDPPITCAEPAAEKAAAGRAPDVPTVLLVDDDDQIREVAREILVDEGYVVVEARDGIEALEVAAGRPVDLLVTDLQMPRMGGEELARRFAREHPHVPVVYISGAAARVGETLARHGAFLAKPFRPEQLTAVVAEALLPPGVTSGGRDAAG